MAFRPIPCRRRATLGRSARYRAGRRRDRRPAHDHGDRAVPCAAGTDALFRCRRPLCRARSPGPHAAEGGYRVQRLFAVGHVPRAASDADADRAGSGDVAGRRSHPPDAAEPLWPARLAAAGGGDGHDDRLARRRGAGRGAGEGHSRGLCRRVARDPPPRIRRRRARSRQQPRPGGLCRAGLCSRRPDERISQPDAGICL